MNDLTCGILLVILAFLSSAVVSALMLRTDVESLMNRIEISILQDNKTKPCELHSRTGLVAIYLISNPFRDYTKFNEANAVCKKMRWK